MLTDPANLKWLTFRNTPLQIPVFKGGPHEVWGLTAFILHSVLRNVLEIPLEAIPALPAPAL